jgi:hypothetical protein
MGLGEVSAASRRRAVQPAKTQRPNASRGRRFVVLLAAGIATLGGLAVTVAGATLLVLDRSERDLNGYLMTTPSTYRTGTYAIVSDNYRAGTASDWFMTRDLLDSVEVRVSGDRSIFVGIARASAVNAYLGSVARDEGPRFGAPHSAFVTRPGGAPKYLPGTVSIWSASVVGVGPRTLKWPAKSGDWRIVVMNADGTRNVAANLSIGARFPHLLMVGIAALGLGIVVLLVGAAELKLALLPGGRGSSR